MPMAVERWGEAHSLSDEFVVSASAIDTIDLSEHDPGGYVLRLTVHDPATPDTESTPWVLPGYVFNTFNYSAIMIRSREWSIVLDE